MLRIKIDFRKIDTWETFHKVFADTMGFPDFYGNNNNAWIDCMSYIDDKDAGMSSVTVGLGESLNIEVIGTKEALNLAPEVFLGFIEIVAATNQRFIEANTKTQILINAT